MIFADRVSLVTGASQGIGEAIAEELGRAGATVVLVDIQKDKLEQVATRLAGLGIRALAYEADVTDADRAARVVEEVLGVERNEVTGLRLRNVKSGKTSEVAVAGVFIAIGHKPNTDAFRGQIELDDKGFVVANHAKTVVDGIFAAGDVQDHVYRQAVTAAGSGCMAALEAQRYLESQGQ